MPSYFPRYVAAQENDTYTLFALKTLMHQAAHGSVQSQRVSRAFCNRLAGPRSVVGPESVIRRCRLKSGLPESGQG
jgi:hypothetical protein